MTEDNKRANAADELERATRTLAAAAGLLDLGLWDDSITRSYYTVFHLTQALLFSRGLQARKHKGVFILFHQEFPDLAAWNQRLEKMKTQRENADYTSNVRHDEAEARTAFADAREFDTLVRARLAT